jgi:sterol 3beta-glucosyltransferase
MVALRESFLSSASKLSYNVYWGPADFFSQPFWGNMVHSAGAGPRPISYKDLNVKTLVEMIKVCISSQALVSAGEISRRMRFENGVSEAVASFHRNLPIPAMTCDFLPHEAACWVCKIGGKKVKLSDKAAQILIDREKINAKDLKL